MPENPIAPNTDVQRLLDAGYQVTIEGDNLIVDNVPYITSSGVISRGALISAFTVVNGVSQTGDHTVWFTGSMPFRDDGTSLEPALHAGAALTQPETVAGRSAQCRFSNYPSVEVQTEMRASIFVKMQHYIHKLESYATMIDPSASASGTASFSFRPEASVFHYPNIAIATAGLEAYEKKLKIKKIAIIGLGGTGSYILDALAKTPASEIHLFDGDVIKIRNAYRMPGAVPSSMVTSDIRKTDYLRNLYNHLRGGIESHSFAIDATNIQILDDCNFVFIAVDDGPSRGLISRFLFQRGIPFIDVGIGIDKVVEDVKLLGRARVTLVTKETTDALRLLESLPTAEDQNEDVYNNIQIAELNALNAMLAIIKYKQYVGFYSEEIHADALKYTLSWNQLKTTP
jgi:hypothetical protein